MSVHSLSHNLYLLYSYEIHLAKISLFNLKKDLYGLSG